MRPRWELRGSGWTLSLQRRRASGEEGRSSNLGAAALVPRGRRRATARLAADELLWVAVSAPAGMPVEARLADGRALDGEAMADGSGGPTLHRLTRAAAATADGVGLEDLADGDTLTVTIGACDIRIRLLAAAAFDRRFGPPAAVEGEPSVYEGWRLP
jgi:hypothetical protein